MKKLLVLFLAAGLLYGLFSSDKPADKGAKEAAQYDPCAAYFDLTSRPSSQGGCRGVAPDDWLQRGWTVNDMTNALDQCFASHGVSPSMSRECSMNDPRGAGYNAVHGR